jgi:RNA polymerase sigma-70 factor (ECF subfamily)
MGREERRAIFAAVARENESALLRTARRLCCGDEDRAQDVVQEALVRGYDAFLRGQFTDGTNWRAWLTRIMTNNYINDYRRRRKWEADVDVETLTRGGETGPSNTHAPPSEMPGVQLMSEIMDEELEKALASLSEGLRLCVLLVDIEGLDYAETAAALDIPIGTVRSRLSRARLILHDRLVEYAKDRYRI